MLTAIRRSGLAAACIAATLLPPPPAAAQAQPAPDEAQAQPAPAEAKRPKICLVLSGGGARGAAHVGVLKVLEELRVPIHCIAGTSMGSIVGGGYASGTSVPEMERIIGGMSTEILFKERPPRQELSIRRKQDDYTILFTPDIGIRDGELLLPKGLVSGIQLESQLRRIAKAQGYRDFDRLPIPYRAVATDLVAGTPVVFSRGELARVMRASMSVPAVVDPVELDGKLLVDGGLVDNLPVDVARTMGADLVIAVNLGTPLMKRDELKSILGVTGQMIGILTEQNVRASLASLKPTDILILPELGDYSAADFDHMTKTIPIGEAAARKVAERLAPLGLPPAEYAALRKQQLTVEPPDLRPVDAIAFPGLRLVNPEVLAAEMQTRPGEPIDQATLDRDMQRLYGTGDFEHVNYRFLEEQGKRVLAVDAVEKSWGPNYLRFGLGLSSDFRGNAFWNLLGQYRMTWLNPLGAEWRTRLQVGSTSSLTTEFYQPLDVRQYFFVAPYAGLERRTFDLFQGDQRLATYNVRRAFAGVDLGSQFTRYGELRAGLYYGTLDATLDTGTPAFAPPPGTITQAGPRTRLFFDQLDNVNFPRTGYGGALDVYSSREAFGATSDYTKWETNGTLAHSFGPHTFNLGFRFGGKLGGGALPGYDLFQWGGFLQQSGLPTGALYGGTIAFGRLVYYNRLLHLPLLEGMFLGGSLEAGRVGDALVPGSPGTLGSASAFFGLDSLIGPVYLGAGVASNGSSSFYFYLGRP